MSEMLRLCSLCCTGSCSRIWFKPGDLDSEKPQICWQSEWWVFFFCGDNKSSCWHFQKDKMLPNPQMELQKGVPNWQDLLFSLFLLIDFVGNVEGEEGVTQQLGWGLFWTQDEKKKSNGCTLLVILTSCCVEQVQSSGHSPTLRGLLPSSSPWWSCALCRYLATDLDGSLWVGRFVGCRDCLGCPGLCYQVWLNLIQE